MFLTAAEVFISITALEFSYTQAPKKMKSLILGFFLMSVSMGNLFTAGVNHFVKNDPPSFTPDVEGIYELQLEASDGDSTEQAKVMIAVGPELPQLEIIDIIKAVFRKVKQALSASGQTDKTSTTKRLPTANAGQFRAVPPNKLVRLYGTADKGDYNGKFSYKWSFISGPEGSKVNDSTLMKADTRNPHFNPDLEGDYEFQFIVNVGQNAKATATNSVTLKVTRENLPPVVNVVEEPIGFVNSVVVLDGTDTVDPNGDALTFNWSFVSKPEDSELEDKDLIGKKFSGPTNKLRGPDYYLFFAGCMLLAALIFIPVAKWYQPKEYLQEEGDEAGSGADLKPEKA